MSRRSSVEGTAGAVLGAAARILIYGAVLAFLVWGVRAGYRFGEEIFYPAAMSGEPGRTVEFTVEEDDNASRIADELKEEGLIQNRLIFLIQSRLFEIEFLPGTYELSTAMNSREILGVLSGDVQEMEEEET